MFGFVEQTVAVKKLRYDSKVIGTLEFPAGQEEQRASSVLGTERNTDHWPK